MPLRRRGGGRAIHALMDAFFRATTSIAARAVSPPEARLARARFRPVQRPRSNGGLVLANLWVRGAG